MYPGPGQSGCAYTGSGGGANFTDTKTDADEASAVPNNASASTRERTNRGRLNAIAVRMSPPEPRLSASNARLDSRFAKTVGALPALPACAVASVRLDPTPHCARGRGF